MYYILALDYAVLGDTHAASGAGLKTFMTSGYRKITLKGSLFRNGKNAVYVFGIYDVATDTNHFICSSL